MVLGIAGRFCAGKSTLAAWLVEQGALEIDVDKLGHEALGACREAVLARFGTVERRELAGVVFADPAALADLEAIVHPWIRSRAETLAAAAAAADPGRLILMNAALLFKLGLDRCCRAVLWVDAPWWLRLWRGLRRDRRGLKATLGLMARQDGLGPQSAAGTADIHRVCNLGRGLGRRQVRRILERYHG